MSRLADRKKAKRLLTALGAAPGRASVLVRSEGGVTHLIVRLLPGEKLRVRPKRFENCEVSYETKAMPTVR